MKMPETVSSFPFCFKAISLFLLYIFLCFQTLTKAIPTSFGNETDYLALMAFKSKISNDPCGVLKSWNHSLHFCQWKGVLCSRRRDRVIALDLSSNYSLVGSLSPHIGNMSFLREFNLSNNQLHGISPPEVGRLLRLHVLTIYNNSLEGNLPSNLSYCSDLLVLRIGKNKLEGKLPVELASLSKLTYLAIAYNHFSGGIPTFIGNFTSLSFLSAAGNDFGGTIPDSLGGLRNLSYVGLSGNKLKGEVPISIYNLSMLSVFSLASNQLHGNLPWDIGLTLPHLTWFQIRENNFSGHIPITLSNVSKLEIIEMGQNNFHGKVTVSFGKLQHLQKLRLWENQLGSGEVGEMDFLTSLTNCSNLYDLEISHNKLQGRLPNSLANLSKQLEVFLVHDNNLFGSIPSGLRNLRSLEALDMGGNNFSGNIPGELSQLKQLQRLYLSYNQFSRTIPDSFGNLTLLTDLILDNNKLEGSIPSSLGDCQNLNWIYLNKNKLSGLIPKKISSLTMSVHIDLSHNHLSGSLPLEVGNLKSLNILDVSENLLSGEITSGLGGCTSLEILHLGGNMFGGNIPPFFSSLRGISELNLSSNNLTGRIPLYMGKLALEILDLSFNNFEGEVPKKGIFNNASAVSVEGNKGLCGGIPKLGLPKCSVKATKHDTLKNVHVIAIVISVLIIATASLFLFFWRRRKNNQQPSEHSLSKPLLQLSYQSLLKATDGFSSTNLLGTGSFGSVYRGVLEEDGTNVVVKVLDLHHRGASKSFIAECEALRNIRHRNLVKIITSCSSIDFQGNDFKALVYELMPNGSLERWLHSPEQTAEISQGSIQKLSLLQRIGIAIDVASALDYLHHHCEEPIVHCDLKPSNVLLDNDMTANLGDFGLARIISGVQVPNQSSTVVVRGTIGYVAPEYGMGSKVSIHGDIYSYGILLLEMMTRKRPTDSRFEGGLNLHNYAKMTLPDRIEEILDLHLLQEIEAFIAASIRKGGNINIMDCLVSVVRIGVACSMESPQDRMDTSDVLKELNVIKNNILRVQPHN